MREEEEKTRVPDRQFWAHFAGIDKPVKVGPEILQRLVDTHGDISAMNVDQQGGWKKASEFGFYPSEAALQRAAAKASVDNTPVPPQYSQAKVMSTDQSLLFVSKLEDLDQIKLRMVNGREVNMPVVLAKSNVQFKGALVVRDSLIRAEDVGADLR